MGDGRSLPHWFWRAIVAVGLSVGAYQFGRSVLVQLQGFLLIVAISLFLSFAMEPAVNFLADRGWKRSIATLFCFVLLILIGGGFLFVMGDLVVTQVEDLAQKAPEYLDESAKWVNDTFGTDVTTDDITKQIESYQSDLTNIAANVGGRVLSVTGTFVGLIFQGFMIVLFSYYMTSQGPQMRRNVCSFIPERNQHTVLFLWELAIKKTGGWIYSRLLLAALSSACTWIFLSILGVPSPLALALWVGLISQFIPAIGTYLAGALPVLIALLNDPIDALWVLGFILIYQQIENYLFAPKITAQTDGPAPSGGVRLRDRRRHPARSDGSDHGPARSGCGAGVRVDDHGTPRGGRLPPHRDRADPCRIRRPGGAPGDVTHVAHGRRRCRGRSPTHGRGRPVAGCR